MVLFYTILILILLQLDVTSDIVSLSYCNYSKHKQVSVVFSSVISFYPR